MQDSFFSIDLKTMFTNQKNSTTGADARGKYQLADIHMSLKTQ